MVKITISVCICKQVLLTTPVGGVRVRSMKTAIYIEQGSTQLVLTPETEWEKSVIGCIEQSSSNVLITRASFYECRGGYYRMGMSDDSLVLRTQVNAKDNQGNELPIK